MLKNALFIFFCIIVAVLYAVFIYPVYPTLVWGLLLLCLGCYRLMLRAEKMFGNKNKF
jgi:hypothetical protein